MTPYFSIADYQPRCLISRKKINHHHSKLPNVLKNVLHLTMVLFTASLLYFSQLHSKIQKILSECYANLKNTLKKQYSFYDPAALLISGTRFVHPRLNVDKCGFRKKNLKCTCRKCHMTGHNAALCSEYK